MAEDDDGYNPKYKWLMKDKANELLDMIHASALYKSQYAHDNKLKTFEELISSAELKVRELLNKGLYSEVLDYLCDISFHANDFIDYTWTLPKGECDNSRRDLLGRFKRMSDSVADFSKLSG